VANHAYSGDIAWPAKFLVVFRLIERRTRWLFFVHQKAPEGGLLLIGQLAFRLSEKLVNEMSSDTIAPDWLFEIASYHAKRD
jgi:hypothetical protein